jgi:putative tricarboxylic transport membrane protein
MERSKLNADVISGAVLAALGVFIVLSARQWDYHSPDGPGPGFFPMWYGIAMIALALLLMYTAFTRPSVAGAPPVWHEIGHALAVWAAFAVSVALLKVLGFMIAFGLLSLFVVVAIYRRPIGVGLAVAVGNSLVFYLLFPLALNVSLPVGFLGF